MKIPESELQLEIDMSADFVRDLVELDRSHESIFSESEFREKLKDLEKKAKDLLNGIIQLIGHDEYGKLDGLNLELDGVLECLERAAGGASEAWTILEIAKLRLRPKSKPDHHFYAVMRAVRIADGNECPRKAREIARRIIMKSGLELPSERKLTYLIHKARY